MSSTSTSPLVGSDGGASAADQMRSYYGMPIINRPVWTWEIPTYFFTGGLAGASAILAGFASVAGNRPLAKAARRVGAGAALVSPVLLISDLGKPERFHHMLRVFKPTSPMSVGSWVLMVFVPAQVGSTLLAELGWLPKIQRLAESFAAALGPLMTTYTAVLASNTAVPVWQDARKELPFVFGAGAAASAGVAAYMSTPDSHAGPARRLAVAGGIAEIASTQVMQRTLGEQGEPYKQGASGVWSTAASAMTVAGTALLGWFGGSRRRRRHPAAFAGAALLLAGAACERWAVYQAGFASADDPKYTVKPQRERVARTGSVASPQFEAEARASSADQSG